jgi:hypothetical protein
MLISIKLVYRYIGLHVNVVRSTCFVKLSAKDPYNFHAFIRSSTICYCYINNYRVIELNFVHVYGILKRLINITLKTFEIYDVYNVINI